MKIKINKGVTVCGPDINLTDYRVVYNVNETLANYLITAGKAVEVSEPKKIEVVEDSLISSEAGIPEDSAGTNEEVQPVTPTRKKFNPRDHK
jgi:hypothetical protein